MSSLSIEMHQLHCQFKFVQTCSDKEFWDGFIKAHHNFHKKTEVIDEKLSNHIKFIKLHSSKNGRTFFDIVVTHVLSQEDIQEIQDSPPVLCDIGLHLFENSTQVWFLYHKPKKAKDVFRLLPPTDEECAKLVGYPPGKSILDRWSIYAWIENLSCGTDKLLLLSPLNIHSIPGGTRTQWREHTAPANDEIPGALDQLVTMLKTWPCVDRLQYEQCWLL